MELNKIKERIEHKIPGASAEIKDLGGGDHIHALVIADAFEGKSLIQQHKLILDLFAKEIQSNDVHALSMKTLTPQQAKDQGFIETN